MDRSIDGGDHGADTAEASTPVDLGVTEAVPLSEAAPLEWETAQPIVHALGAQARPSQEIGSDR